MPDLNGRRGVSAGLPSKGAVACLRFTRRSAALPSAGAGRVGCAALDRCGGVSTAPPSTGAGAFRMCRPRRVRGRVDCAALWAALNCCGGVSDGPSTAPPSTGAGRVGWAALDGCGACRLGRPRRVRSRVGCAALDGCGGVSESASPPDGCGGMSKSAGPPSTGAGRVGYALD
jgi:hypothetical protein